MLTPRDEGKLVSLRVVRGAAETRITGKIAIVAALGGDGNYIDRLYAEIAVEETDGPGDFHIVTMRIWVKDIMDLRFPYQRLA
jgi:hypothetical protein